MEKVRVRFAPSPTGLLHVGNARTALFNWLFARQKGGVFILRVEDTDIERSAVEYEKRLIEDFRWLGLDWDEGPDVGGELGPYRQSERIETYRKYVKELLERGKAYHCFCPPDELEREREEALSLGRMPIYSGRCKSIPLEEANKRIDAREKAAVRLKTPEQGNISYDDLIRGTLSFDLKLIGDPILIRSSGLPAYNYAVVIDDFFMKITHVIRGEDHISNTPRQLLTYQALSFSPPQFAHLPMVMGKDNTRLSKRHGATAVDQFEKQGFLSSALFNYLAFLGWAPPEGREVLTKSELVELFDLNRVGRSSAIFDYEKLSWINRQHIKRLTPAELGKQAYHYLKEANILPDEMTEAHWKWLEKAVKSLIEGVDRFSQLPSAFSLLFDFSPSAMDDEAKSIIKSEASAKVVMLCKEKMLKAKEFNYELFVAITEEIKKETGYKGKALYHPLRVALTARASGLELDKFIPLIEEGTKLVFPKPIKNCLERVTEVLGFIK